MGGLVTTIFNSITYAACTFFTTACPPPSPLDDSTRFNIELMNMGEIETPDFDILFQQAARRWEEIIVADLPEAYPFGDLFGGFFSQQLWRPVDDVLIGYGFRDLNGIIGFAGPRRVRRNDDGVAISTVSGIMMFDINYFQRITIEDAFAVILHEMGHVLGFGILWDTCDASCRRGRGFLYECPAAQNQYQLLGLGEKVGGGEALMVSDEGGRGSECGHWDEQSFDSPVWSEIMTPFFDRSKRQLLTAVTAAALEDIGGYVIDVSAADPIPAPTESPPVDSGFLGILQRGGRGGVMTSTTFSLDGLIERPEIVA